MKAWHFVNDALRDGSPIPPDGKVLRYNGPVAMCHTGLHASVRLIDALDHAPGSAICRVDCDEISEQQSDKLVCRKRTILWRVNGKQLLRRFARACTLDAAEQQDTPEIMWRYLRTGDESLRHAASVAAMEAANSEEWVPGMDAYGAARQRARLAICEAAWGATTWCPWAAAGAAARNAAIATADRTYAAAAALPGRDVWDDARVAARAAQNRRLTRLVYAAHRQH